MVNALSPLLTENDSNIHAILSHSGERCDQCGLQHSVHLCYNGGVCTINNSVPVCKCPPGFDPRTDCKKRTCDGYCMNEALCTLNGNQLTCQCQAGFDGPRCSNYKDKCSPGYCKNNGKGKMFCKELSNLGAIIN